MLKSIIESIDKHSATANKTTYRRPEEPSYFLHAAVLSFSEITIFPTKFASGPNVF